MPRLLALRSALVLSALAIGPARSGADEPAASPPAATDPLSGLEAGPLRRADLVVLGAVRLVRTGVGNAPTLARVDVEKSLYARAGVAPETAFSLFVGGPHNTDDPRRPFAPYLAPGSDGRYVLFVRRTPSGSGWSLDTLFPASGEEGAEKVEVLEREIALAAIADEPRRREKTLAHFLELVRAPRPWSRTHGARELASLATAAPDLFTADVVREVDALRARAFDPDVRAVLSDIRRRFPTAGPAAEPPAAGGSPASGVPEVPAAPRASGPSTPDPELFSLRRKIAEEKDPAARIDLLTRIAKAGKAEAAADLLVAFEAPEAPVRERAALLLADVAAYGSWPRLRAAFEGEPDPAVQEAIVRAAGLLGGDEDTAWIAARGATPCLRQAASFALARVRTPASLAVLAGWGKEALAASPPDRAAARIVDYLRSPAFVEAERKAGRAVGSRGAAPASPTSPSRDGR